MKDSYTTNFTHQLKGHSNPVWALTQFQDKILSGSLDGTIKLWDPLADSNNYIKTFVNSKTAGSVYSLLLLQNNQLAIGYDNKLIKILDLESGEYIRELKGHEGCIYSLASLNESGFVSQGGDGTLRIWDQNNENIRTITDVSGYVSTVIVNDGYIISENSKNEVGIWSAEKGQLVHTLKGHPEASELMGKHMRALSFLSDKNILATGSNNYDIKIWDIRSQQSVGRLEGHKNYVNALSVTSDKLFASASGDKSIKIWDIRNMDCVETINTNHDKWIQGLINFSKGESKVLISGSGDNTIGVFPIHLHESDNNNVDIPDVTNINLSGNNNVGDKGIKYLAQITKVNKQIAEEKLNKELEVKVKEIKIENSLKKEVELKERNIEEKKETEEFQKNIINISRLIAEGNDEIQVDGEKAILLLGNTGSGKSTVAHLLSNRKLQPIYDDETGIYKLDAVDPLDSIRISHNKTAETKIPNKCKITDQQLVVWDCPGFNDTDIVQEIANSFYISKLISTSKQLKFVLVASESDIDNNRGVNFVSLVDQLVNNFKTITSLKTSVSLVISHATAGRKVIHLKKSVEKILEENKSLSTDTKEMIEYLLKSVHLFHKPTSEDILPDSELLSAINSSTDFVLNDKVGANMALSTKAKHYAEKLLVTSSNNLTQVLDTLNNAIKDCNNCLTIDNNNIFVKSYDQFYKWLPDNIQKLKTIYTTKYYDKKYDSVHGFKGTLKQDSLDNVLYFIHIAQQDALKEGLGNKNNLTAIKVIHSILDIFKDFVTSEGSFNSDEINSVKQKIANYSYILNQQIEYIEFFGSLLDKQLPYQEDLQITLISCQKVITETLEKQIKSIKLDNSSRPDYYKQAIKYLEIYKEDKDCGSKIAQANNSLGNIYSDDLKPNIALGFYLKALKFDKTLAETYEKIGDILTSEGKYNKALNYYKVADQKGKVKFCYDKLIESSPKDRKLLEEKGDYLASTGQVNKAITCYTKASDLTYNKQIKKDLLEKVDLLLTGKAIQEIVDEHQKIKNNDEIYNFELVTLDSVSLEKFEDLLLLGNIQNDLPDFYV